MIAMLEPNLVRGSEFPAEPQFMEFRNEAKQILEKTFVLVQYIRLSF